jgi:hypothetical protein
MTEKSNLPELPELPAAQAKHVRRAVARAARPFLPVPGQFGQKVLWPGSGKSAARARAESTVRAARARAGLPGQVT